MKTMLLLDVNVWLAFAFRTHEHHSVAKPWFDALTTETAYFCRMTQQGFLRLATNAKSFPHAAVSLAEAWVLYDSLLADPRVDFIAEPADIEPIWRGYTQSERFASKVWNDAYLAAFARVHGLEVITFDRGFKAYDGVKLTILQ